MARRLDILIFGASGFTGKCVISEVHRLTKAKGRSLTWGVAGRSEQKLIESLTQVQKKIGVDLHSTPIIIADCKDEDSLIKMAATARVIINCCGPYRFYGESVVKACVAAGTHHIDVSGEPQYMEGMQLKYHQEALEKGVYIISACGFDSIPADLGVIYLEEALQGTLNSVETYLQAKEEGRSVPGAWAHFTTWESAVHGLAHAAELGTLRRKLFPQRLPTFLPKLLPRPAIHKHNNTWAVEFIGADRSVVVRSQRHFYDTDKKRPVQIQTYVSFTSWWTVYKLVIYGTIFKFLTKYEFGRYLLLKHPKLFSGGMFSHEGPPEEKQNNTLFEITFKGEGWSEKALDVTGGQEQPPPDKKIVGRVSGRSPGYGLTGTAATLAAITVLTETDALPKNGGVYTPGAAFAHTSIILQLQENGLRFEVISIKDVGAKL